MIEGITGYYTGSMYNDIALRKKGFYGEGVPADSGLVMTVKTHGHTTGEGAHVASKMKVEFNHHTEVNHTAILLIRNPYKAIIGSKHNLDWDEVDSRYHMSRQGEIPKSVLMRIAAFFLLRSCHCVK